MQSIIIPKDKKQNINVYMTKEKLDEFQLLSFCKHVLEKEYGYITVDNHGVDIIWKWIEKSNIKIISSINMNTNQYSVDELFKCIKTNSNNGSNMVEVILPTTFFDVDLKNPPHILNEYLSAMLELNTNPLKIVIETGYISNILKLREILYLIKDFKYIKSASGLYQKSSTIPQLNIIMDEMKAYNISIDFLFDPATSNKFIVEDAFRLALSWARSNRNEDNNLIVSIPFPS